MVVNLHLELYLTLNPHIWPTLIIVVFGNNLKKMLKLLMQPNHYWGGTNTVASLG